MLLLYFTPIIMATFAAAFIASWWRAKTSPAAVFYGAGYAMSATAFTLELIIQAAAISPFLALATDLAFIGSACLIAYGTCVQFDRAGAYRYFFYIMVSHAGAQVYSVFWLQELATRVTIDLSGTTFALFTASLILRRATAPGAQICKLMLWGTSAFYFLFAVASQSILRDELNAGPVWQSEHFEAIIVGTAFVGVAIGCALLINLIVAQLRAAQREALTDPLTGLANRRGLSDIIANLENSRDSVSPPHGLAVLDLDRFKKVNDTHGHAAGDQVLVEVSKRIKALLRPQDSIVRLGGEEFCMVMPTVNRDMARLMSERFRQAVSDPPIEVKDNAGNIISLEVTASFGVAEFHGSADLSEAMTLADKGLYCAKQNGRNRVWAYQDMSDLRPTATNDDPSVEFGANVYPFRARA